MATIFFHVSLNVSAVVAVSTAVCASVCVCVCVCMSHAIGTTSAQRKHELQMHLRALFTRPAPPPPARMRHMPHAAHATRRHPQLLMFSSSSSTPFLSDNYNIYTAREGERERELSPNPNRSSQAVGGSSGSVAGRETMQPALQIHCEK